jgi:hypothetical protein
VLTAAPEDVDFGGGEIFKVGPLSFAAHGRLQRVIDRLAVSPLEAVKPLLDGLPEPAQSELVREAKAAQRRYTTPQVGTARGWAVLFDSDEGRREFFRVVMTESNPAIDGPTLDALYRRLTAAAFVTIRDIALEIPRDPKADATPTPELAEALAALERAAEAAAEASGPWRWVGGEKK